MNEPQTPVSQRSLAGRFSSRLVSWRTFRRALIALIGLITLVALVFTEENWRGKRDWERFKARWEAQGEKFDLASFTPKPVPPEQNFFATPLLAPLSDYTMVKGEIRWGDSNGLARAKSVAGFSSPLGNWQLGEFCDLQRMQKEFLGNTNFPANPKPKNSADDVLFALSQYDLILDELRLASQRPYAVYSVRPGPDLEANLQLFSVLKALTQVTVLHALANLDAGRNEAALADVKLAFHLGQALRSEPLLISQMVRIAILKLSLQPVWEGLAKHRWTDAQLAELQNIFHPLDLLEDYGFTMRGERAFSNELMAQYIAGNFGGFGGRSPGFKFLGFLAPRGLFYQNQIAINRLIQQPSLQAMDATAHRVYPEKCGTNLIAAALGARTPYNLMAWMMFPAYQKVAQNFAVTQTCLDQAILAGALERCWLANGTYPETLAGLVPKFLNKIPPDVIDGQPLKYRRTADGNFILYSVGWNEKDDGGTVVLNKGGKGVNWSEGDWVWSYPAN